MVGVADKKKKASKCKFLSSSCVTFSPCHCIPLPLILPSSLVSSWPVSISPSPPLPQACDGAAKTWWWDAAESRRCRLLLKMPAAFVRSWRRRADPRRDLVSDIQLRTSVHNSAPAAPVQSGAPKISHPAVWSLFRASATGNMVLIKNSAMMEHR